MNCGVPSFVTSNGRGVAVFKEIGPGPSSLKLFVS